MRVTLERHPPDGVTVHVADTGCGIAEDDLERVFDEFVQVGAANGGTGLGLPSAAAWPVFSAVT